MSIEVSTGGAVLPEREPYLFSSHISSTLERPKRKRVGAWSICPLPHQEDFILYGQPFAERHQDRLLSEDRLSPSLRENVREYRAWPSNWIEFFGWIINSASFKPASFSISVWAGPIPSGEPALARSLNDAIHRYHVPGKLVKWPEAVFSQPRPALPYSDLLAIRAYQTRSR